MILSRFRILVFAVWLSAGATGAAMAASPADADIAAALADLDRYEQQAEGLSPSRKAAIRRLQRLLGPVRDRLQRSPNKNHPSYREAAGRLEALNRRLETMLAGGSTPAPAASQAQTVTPVAPLAEVDPALAPLLAELEALEREAAALAPGDVPTANALIERLNALVAAFMRVSDRSGPGWNEAAARINALGPAIVATAKQPAGTPPASRTAGDGGARTAAGDGSQAAGELASYEVVRLKRARREIVSLSRDLARLPSAELQRPEALRKWQARFARLRQNLAPFEARRGDPRVAEAFAELERAERAFAALRQQAQGQLGELGDVVARVAEIEARYVGSGKLPEPLRPPIDERLVESWARAILEFRRRLPEDIAYLQKARATSTMVPRKDLDRLLRWVGDSVPRRLQKVVDDTFAAIDARMRAYHDRAEAMARIDPADEHMIRVNYLDPDVYSEVMGEIAEGKRLAELAAGIRQALGMDPSPYREDFARLIAAERKIAETSRAALESSRMPPERASDPRLREIAEEVLRRPEYGVGEWLRLVVNADLQSYQETRGEVEGNRITVYEVDWDEFQVTTAETEGDRVFLWYNTLKFFRKAHRTTPKNRWILAERFRGPEILRANVEG